jgi:hypothetical protein
MREFYLIIDDVGLPQPRRIDFRAEGPDHAFQIARNEVQGVNVALWEGEQLLARMTKTEANIWELHPLR